MLPTSFDLGPGTPHMCNSLVEKTKPTVEKRIPNAADEEDVDSEDDASAPSDDELDNLKA
jgi:hypothetical protein